MRKTRPRTLKIEHLSDLVTSTWSRNRECFGSAVSGVVVSCPKSKMSARQGTENADAGLIHQPFCFLPKHENALSIFEFAEICWTYAIKGHSAQLSQGPDQFEV